MSVITSVILWAVLLFQTLCSSSIPDGETDSNEIDSDPNAMRLFNTATNLGRMEASGSDLPVEVARTIRRLSSYFLKEADDILNALDDVLFCIKMAKGQLAQLRLEAPPGFVGGEAEEILNEAEADLDEAVLILKANFKFSPNFRKDFSFSRTHIRGEDVRRLDSASTIENFQEIWDSAYAFNLKKEGSVTEFSPSASDHCMSQIQPRPSKCVDQASSCRPFYYCPVSVSCWLMTTRPRTRGYYLTHQLLFLLLGENGDCAPDFEAHVRRYFGDLLPAGADAGAVTSEIMRLQCRGVLYDANIIAHGEFQDILKDLFVEQGFLCGAAVNMSEFFNPDWVRAAISWQEPSGCYGFPHPSGLGIDYPSTDAQKGSGNAKKSKAGRVELRSKVGNVMERSLTEDSGYEWQSTEENEERSSVEDRIQQERPAPTARREQIMSESCYAHFSAVALGYFAVAMRYLAE